MRYGLLGEKLGHSFSKEIHEKLSRYSYELMEVAPEDLDLFLKTADFDGINVTIPYKQAVIPYLAGLTDRAKAIGAVNTIVKRDGKLYGDNTDFGGLTALIRRMKLSLSGKTVLIAGTGGTSRTAKAAAEALGAAEVLKLSRSGKDGAMTYEEAYEKASGAAFLINTTPAGMYPDVGGIPVDLSRLPALEGVVDVVYNPLTTRLVKEAREKGIPAENGLYMLTAQAVLAAEAFTGESFGDAEIDRIYREILSEKRNIVLIGMPGSGKSTVGRYLANRTGRPLYDSDEEIVLRAKMPITEIFRTQGETSFRDMETEVLKELSSGGGRILSTGGGAVLKKENVDALKSNGTVVFLDRPLSELLPSGTRPLADNAEKIRNLYQERMPVYRAAADLTVPVRGTPAGMAEEILKRL